MSMAKIAALGAILLGLGAMAGAQGPDQSWPHCRDSNADLSIGACTAIIEADTETNANLALAYGNRGAAYFKKGQYDKAIQDCSEAIRLQPNYASALGNRGSAYYNQGEYDKAIQDYGRAIHLKPDYAAAYNNRGAAYLGKGQYAQAVRDYDEAIRLRPNDASAFVNRGIAYRYQAQYDRAIQDYDEAIRLKPDYANAYNSRGITQFSQGHFPQAADDFRKGFGFNPSDTYTALWLHLAKKNARQDDAQDFEKQTAQMNSSQWPAPLAKLLLGQLTVEKTLGAADNPDSNKARDQHCEAEFFIGEYFLLSQEKANALAHFRSAHETCPPNFLEYAGAAVEMERLGTGSPP